MRFITVSTRPMDDDTDLGRCRQPRMLRESAVRYNIPLENIGIGGVHDRCGRGRRKLVTKYLADVPGDEPVLLTDAWDSFIAGTAAEIEYAFSCFQSPIVFSTEINRTHPSAYPKAPTRFAYVNGGGFVGRASALLQMLTADDFWPSFCNCDQWAYGDWFIKHQDCVSLDYHCRLFQTLHWNSHSNRLPRITEIVQIKDGKLYNSETNTWPLICHGNGRFAEPAMLLWESMKCDL